LNKLSESIPAEKLVLEKKYMLDKRFPNRSVVILKKVFGANFCFVMDPETKYEWQTMIRRLSEIETEKPELSDKELRGLECEYDAEDYGCR
jgi:hypothetical protein